MMVEHYGARIISYRLAIGVSVNGSSVNISEVLVEYTLNIIFAYCQVSKQFRLHNL